MLKQETVTLKSPNAEFEATIGLRIAGHEGTTPVYAVSIAWTDNRGNKREFEAAKIGHRPIRDGEAAYAALKLAAETGDQEFIRSIVQNGALPEGEAT